MRGRGAGRYLAHDVVQGHADLLAVPLVQLGRLLVYAPISSRRAGPGPVLSFWMNLAASICRRVAGGAPVSRSALRSPRMAELTFTLKSTSGTGVRLGELTFGSFRAATPSVLVKTSRLAVPHTTLERFRRIVSPDPRIAGVLVYGDKLYENPRLVRSDGFRDIHRHARLEGLPVLLALEDGRAGPETDALKNGPEHVTVANTSGALRVGIREYAELCVRLAPDAVVLPHDRARLAAPAKHLKRAVQRTSLYAALFAPAAALPALAPAYAGGGPAGSTGLGLALLNYDETSIGGLEGGRPGQLRYISGAFTPVQVVALAQRGVDLFDTSFVDEVTRQHQALLVTDAATGAFTLLSLADERYFAALEPAGADCGCLACADGVTRAYLHHLIRCHEMLATVHLQAHNLHQYLQLLSAIRAQ